MYDLAGYGRMIVDPVRRPAYEEALRRSVTRDTIVLDVGCGAGHFAMAAARLGAHHVIAVEPDGVIEVGRQLAQTNGLADRITFVEAPIADVTLDRPADVVVSDLRGILPLFGTHLTTIADVRDRLLAPNAIQIPARDRIWATLVHAPVAFTRQVGAWDDATHGFDVGLARDMVSQQMVRTWVERRACLAEPRMWTELDYLTLTSPDTSGAMDLDVVRGGVGHGILLWFETELVEGVGFDNAPGQPKAIYEQALLPWPHPVDLRAGMQVAVSIDARLVAGDDYVWRWRSRIGDDGPTFDQSTFFAAPVSRNRLHRRGAETVPEPDERTEVARFVLRHVDGTRSLGHIAAALGAAFPRRFSNRQAALTAVEDVIERMVERGAE